MAERQRQGLGGASGNGFAGLVRLRTDSDAGLRALVECCASRRPTPYKADDYALLTHEAYRTTLRALRRDPAASPRTRRGAMAALVAGGGADGLDARDLAAIERLIRVQIADETPSAPSPQLSGWWLAVPGASYEGLFGALDLHHRRPITCATGVEASGREIRVPVPGGDGDRRDRGPCLCHPPEWDGDPLPWETHAVDDPDFDPEYDDAPPNAGTAGARTACGHLSVDPAMVGSGTETRGHGWLALTSPHAGHGAFPGILPLLSPHSARRCSAGRRALRRQPSRQGPRVPLGGLRLQADAQFPKWERGCTGTATP
ncbi:hypothetical protein [Streptomyces sp. NPDC001717]|uniref:hypothetical protein n=1 Tax=Streptomyces sp. NPDC001717 TaxID=3364604 RepID=UPI00369B0AD5